MFTKRLSASDTSRDSARCEFTVEKLEYRLQLAGDVQAVLTSLGDLRITGTNDSNQIMVTADVAGNVLVRGMPGTGTTVNGVPQVVFMETDDARIQHNVNINLRRGDNYLEIDDVLILGDLRVRSGAGLDTIGIIDTQVGDDTSLVTGAGADLVGLVRDVFAGQLSIVTGSGADAVGFASCSETRERLMINTGSDFDIVLLEGHHYGTVSVATGASADRLVVNRIESNGNASLLVGAGDDYVLVPNTVAFLARTTLRGAAGRDGLILHPSAIFDPISTGVETVVYDATVNAAPVAVAAEMATLYVMRGGNAADLPC
jgi:hypothetical protein